MSYASLVRLSLSVLLVGLGSAFSQPSAADKAKLRDEAAVKADALIREGKFADALELATTCVKLSKEIDGGKHWRTFDAEHRLKLAEQAKAFPAEKQKKLVAALTFEEQVKAAENAKPADALKLSNAALAGYADTVGEESVEAARVWHLIGRIGLGSNDAKGAKEANEKALAVRRKSLPETHPDIGKSLNNLGWAQSTLGAVEDAIKSYKEAIRIWKISVGASDLLVAMGLNNLGEAQRVLREDEAAKGSFTDALAIRRKSLPEAHPDIAISLYLYNLGLVQRDLGEYEAAKESHAEDLAIRRKILQKDDPNIAIPLMNLGNVQRLLREYEAAKGSQKEALAILRKAFPKDHPGIAISLTNLGIVQEELREHEAAKESHTEALAILGKAFPKDHPGIAISLSGLGRSNNSLGEFEEAKKCHTEALTIRRKLFPGDHCIIADSLTNLGIVQYSLREYVAAKESHTEAHSIHRKCLPKGHPDVAVSLSNLLRLELITAGPSALAHSQFVEVLAVTRSDLARLSGWQAEAEQLRSVVEAEKMVGLYLSAIDESSETEAVSYDQLVLFKGAVTASQRRMRDVRANRTDATTADLLRQLVFADRQLLEASLLDRSGVRKSEAEAHQTRRLAALTEQRKLLERQLSNKSGAFLAMQMLGSKEVSASLPERSVLIDFREYLHVGQPPKGAKEPVFEKRFVAFVVSPGKDNAVVRVPLGKAEAITTLIKRWRASYAVGKAPPKGQPDPALELRKLVWEPLAQHLPKDVKTVLFSPDGSLTGLPFAAVPGSKPNTYLLEEYAFVNAPVPILLPELFAKKPAADAFALLAAGNVDFGAADKPGGFRPLINTGLEVDNLKDRFSNAFPKGATRVLKSAEATKAAFVAKSPDATYVHLATHGYFADESVKSALDTRDLKVTDLLSFDRRVSGTNPDLLSGVAFAGVNDPDPAKRSAGLLTAREVAELNLAKTELVVLSACETGLGKVAGGEGVLGLQRAFQVAGAKRVVSTLWSVDDTATRKVMERFYDNLWVKKLPAAEALREAQLWAIKGGIDGLKPGEEQRGVRPPGEKTQTTDHRHPYFWAAFTLAGDPR